MDWNTLLLGEESWGFLGETAFRSTVMFVVILCSLRLLGKRGIKQLSVFELGVIIGLGSAAGDPMFYKDVGLLPGMLVFVMVVSLYRLITYLINRSEKFMAFVEGRPTTIIRNGEFLLENFKKEPVARDELFSQLRLHSVEHLGQVEEAILENNGELSIYYFSHEDVRFGLPIRPGGPRQKSCDVHEEGTYACCNCGYTAALQPTATTSCTRCGKDDWSKAINRKRCP